MNEEILNLGQEISMCATCFCMTKTVKGKCGKCEKEKPTITPMMIKDQAIERAKTDIIALLEKERWYPIRRPTKMEMDTAELLNKILDNVIEKIKEYNIEK